MPELRGRAGECAQLDRLLAGAREGQSAVLVIRGEAGVGKTALLRYAAEHADGFRSSRSPGVESEMAWAYSGLHQLCAPMLGQLDALPAPQALALRVALGLAAGDPPDRFLVALATIRPLTAAEGGPPSPLQAAEVEHLRGQVGFDQRRVGDAARLLGSAAKRLEPLDDELARATHLEALGAAIWAADLDRPGARSCSSRSTSSP